MLHRSILLLGLAVCVFLTAAPRGQAQDLQPRTGDQKATVSLEEGADTVFNLNERADDVFFPPVKFSGCDPGVLRSYNLETTERGGRGVRKVSLESRGNDVAWLNISFDEP